jgi:hypothetical protein
MKQIKNLIFTSLLLILITVCFSQTTYSQKTLTDVELIKAVTTRPWAGENYPLLPSLTTVIKGQVIGELNNPAIRRAYEKLDANRRNVDWFSGLEELEKLKAVWALLSCLIHPHDDVQIKALNSVERLNDKAAVPFLLVYAEYMAVLEGGSENATIHGIIHETIARTLSSLTGIKLKLDGQDPGRLMNGVMLWRKWLIENEKSYPEMNWRRVKPQKKSN